METKEMETTNQQEKLQFENSSFHKNQLRKQFLEGRKAMAADQVNSYSKCICNRILESNLYKDAKTILVYMPIRNEVDTQPIIKQCLSDGKDLYLPKVQGTEMAFYKLKSLDDLSSGAFGIQEPKETNPLSRREGLMLVPGVAFSKTGFRIGYGGGYYDKYLAKEHGFATVGLFYELQLCHDIFPDIHDIQLNLIVTEKGIYI